MNINHAVVLIVDISREIGSYVTIQIFRLPSNHGDRGKRGDSKGGGDDSEVTCYQK